MYDAARLAGRRAARDARRDAGYLAQNNIDASANLHRGRADRRRGAAAVPRLRQGNFIEATDDTCYFQLGESKYGKPILDRVVIRGDAAEGRRQVHADLVRLDDEVQHLGGPADRPALVYASDTLAWACSRRLDEDDPYFPMLRTRWGGGLRRVFAQLPDPDWM